MASRIKSSSACAAMACAVLTVTACSHTSSMSSAEYAKADMWDASPRVAVATAYAPELGALLPELTNKRQYAANGVTYYTGVLAGQDVVLFKTGVSTVNAAMNTQLLLDSFEVTEIVVSGVAGGVDPDLSIGDVTVPAKWGKYDEWVFMRDGAAGEAVASAWFGSPEFQPFDFMRPYGAVIASDGDPEPTRQFWWPVDAAMLAIAEKAAETVSFERCSPNGQCLDETPHVELGGHGVSGSIFMDNARVRAYLEETYDAQVVEMETAAIAMVAHANRVPYIAFRTLSDLAGGGGAEANEINAFEHIAAQNSASFVLEYLRTRTSEMGADSAPVASAGVEAEEACEINYSSMPLYSGGRLGDERIAKLKALYADYKAEQDFIASLHPLTLKAAALVSDLSPEDDFAIVDVWGGYLGTTSPSLAGRFAAGAEQRADAARIGAAIGYVYLQDSVLVQCDAEAGEPNTAPSFELTEVPGADALNAAQLRSFYGMMIGEADGVTELGFTYYPDEDRFSSLGFLEGGAVEREAIESVLDTLEALTPGRAPQLSERIRWVAFPANDWGEQPGGAAYVEAADLSDVRDELDALQAEFIAAIDRLPAP